MRHNKLDEESETESLDDQEANREDVKFEEELGMQRPRHDRSQVEIATDLGERAMDKEHGWLDKKGYSVELEPLRRHVQLAARKTAPQTPEQAGDASLLKAGQRQVFDRVVGHYLHSPDTQLLMQVDGVAGSGKSTVIDMISSHLALHAAQRDESDQVFCAAPARVAAFNIRGSTLHQLFRLPVNRPWFELDSETLAAVQAGFRRCKLLIIDEKSMIGLKMLHQIDVWLRAIMARPTVFFGGMNILLCGDFTRLPPVLDTALYALPVAAKVLVEVMAGKNAYDAFTETVALTEVM